MNGLTPTQARALEFIGAFIDDKGWSPTLQEIATAIGITSKGRAHRIISALTERGAITFHPRRRRSIALVAQPRPPEGIDFLPEQLAVWVRVIAARAGVKPLDVVTEAVRDAYANNAKRNREQTGTRETSGVGKVAA